MSDIYRGLWPACPTLIDADENVDVPAMSRLAERLQNAGVNGLWLFGSGGEGPALSDKARRQTVETVLSATGGTLPVLVGISAESTHRALERWKPLADLPVAGAFSTPPIYYTYTQRELVDYFRQLAEGTGRDLFIYHNPFFAHTSLSIESVVELSHLPGIRGAKDSTTSLVTTQRLVNECAEGFATFQGEEQLAAVSVLAGAAGLVSVISAARPEIFLKLYEAASAGDVVGARNWQRTVAAFVRELGLDRPSTNGGFIGAVKQALAADGYGSGQLTAPFRAPSAGIAG
jgi:4-hydroxy-tetrahydrodipicolinate synthase